MSTTDLDTVAWDLDPLVDGEGAAGADRFLDEADQRASAFATEHAGKVADLDGPGLVAALTELAGIGELVGRVGNYAMLRFATDTADPANGALLQKVQERGTGIETQLLFFDLEWAALDDARADELLAADGLDTFRHYLRTARRYRPHLLTEPEEKLLAEKSVTGRDAWSRLFSEVTSAIKVDLDGADEAVPLDVALSQPDVARPRAARPRGRAGLDRAGADAPDPGLHLQHADGRQGDRRPPAQLPVLDLLAQPLQRGVRRVGPGAGHRGPRRLRAAAPLVPAQGAPARDRPPRGLRPHGRRRRRGGEGL